jgi:hypothetical protein
MKIEGQTDNRFRGFSSGLLSDYAPLLSGRGPDARGNEAMAPFYSGGGVAN